MKFEYNTKKRREKALKGNFVAFHFSASSKRKRAHNKKKRMLLLKHKLYRKGKNHAVLLIYVENYFSFAFLLVYYYGDAIYSYTRRYYVRHDYE